MLSYIDDLILTNVSCKVEAWLQQYAKQIGGNWSNSRQGDCLGGGGSNVSALFFMF